MIRYKLSFPTQLKGTVKLPASKSISNRVLIINALSERASVPDNLSDADDTQVMIKALASDDEMIDIMAAGTAMRFLTAYYSVTPGTHVITGTERMRQRPIRILVDALRELGAHIEYVANEGYPPLQITGQPLNGTAIRLRGDVSSQYISALLMIAPVLQSGLRLFLTGEIISRPYIDLTLQLMNDFGVRAIRNSENSIIIEQQSYKNTPFVVENDWSAASYWYQMAALTKDAEIELPGLFRASYQGDSRVAKMFAQLGVSSTFSGGSVVLHTTNSRINHLEEDFIDVPDLAQTFVVTCALLDIPFHFTGLQSLKIKETDRMTALIKEMAKLGYLIREQNNSELIWDGERIQPETSPVIDTYEDHRMAMAFAPAAICFPALNIADPHVVSKSYSGYWDELKKIGVNLQIVG